MRFYIKLVLVAWSCNPATSRHVARSIIIVWVQWWISWFLKNQIRQNEGSKLYLTLKQTWNIFILDSVNIWWLTNKGLVWAFHLDKLHILSAFFVYGKVMHMFCLWWVAQIIWQYWKKGCIKEWYIFNKLVSTLFFTRNIILMLLLTLLQRIFMWSCQVKEELTIPHKSLVFFNLINNYINF